MYIYINVISIAMFFTSLYILYARLSINKTKQNCILISILISIIFLKMLYIASDGKLINFNYSYQIIIVLLINTLHINFKNLNKENDRVRGTLISIIMAISLFIYILNSNNEIVININSIAELISSIYICSKIFKINIKFRYNKSIEIKEQSSKNNIELREYKEKLKVNKNITKIINENIEKKQILLQNIIGDSKRCTFIIDSDGYILNEDNSFSKIWNEYTDYKYKIEMNSFLNNSIKNKNDFMKYVDKAKEGNEIQGEIKAKDGRIFKCIYAPFKINNENIAIICAMKDITYEKNSEIKTKENNIKYKKIVDTIPYTILLLDENNILYNNDKNKDIDFYKEDIKNIILKKSITGELYYKNKIKEDFCLNIDRIEFDDGESEKSLVVVRDITNYKKLLKDVEYSKEKYESLVNVIPEGIYVSDLESGNINYSNQVFLDFVQNDEVGMINKHNFINSSKLNLDNSAKSFEFNRTSINNKQGKSIDIECGEILIDINKKLNRIGIVRDITEQVKAEKIEREIEIKKKENKIKSEFFVNISHELKTPLNVITSSNQLLEIMNKEYISKNPNSEISKCVKIVKKHTYMLMGLIDNIMDLAKLESQFHECNTDYYNIVSVVEDVCDEFNKYVGINGIEILFDTDEEERIANIDPDDIEKIILTLLSMVIRYSYSNSIVNVDLTSLKNKSIITIKNEGGYDYDRYINDQERRSLDIGITVAQSTIELYNGKVDIKIGSKKEIEINIEIETDENICDYKKRVKLNGDDFIYTEYLRMCNF